MISKHVSSERVGNGTFSANVSLSLHVGNQCYDIGQLGPGFAILREVQNIAATEGEIESIIDGKSNRRRIRFTKPITVDSKQIEFETL